MNRVFSTVWSASRGQLVVASELAHGHSKGASGASGSSRARRVLQGAALAGAMVFAGAAFAYNAGSGSSASGAAATAVGDNSKADYAQGTAFGESALAGNTDATALGQDAHATGDQSTAIGQGSDATGIESTALGEQSKAQADQATALGDGSKATLENSVALGAGSTTSEAVATSGTTIGGNSYSFAGGTPDAGDVVSVGSAGNERQIQNVAAGQLNAGSTDAVNGSQLFATNQQVTTNTTGIATNADDIDTNLTNITTNTGDISANSTNITSLQTDALQWDATLGAYDARHGSASPQQISNVAAGAANTDAVNVSQLKGVTTALGGDASVDSATGAVIAPSYNVGGANYNNVGDAITHLQTDAPVQYSDSSGNATPTTPSNDVTLVGAATGPVTMHNVADGQLNATSSEAVNGSQLYATNQQVTTNTGDIATNTGNITNNSTAITGLTNDALLWNPGMNAYDASHGSASPQQIANVAAGTANTDAVNVGQLNSSIAAAAGPCVVNGTGIQCSADGSGTAGGANSIAIGTGSQASGDQSIAIGNGNVVSGNNSGAFGDPNTITGAGSYAIGNNNTIDANNAFVLGNNVTIGTGLNGAVALGNNSTVIAATPTAGVTLGGNNYGFAGATPDAGDVVSVGSVGNERQIQNVAAGQLSETSTDAVNGSQLYATNQQVDANTTDISDNTGDIGDNTTDIADNTTDIADNTTDIADNTTDIANNTTDIADNTTDIANNTTNIADNTTDIANNTTNIADNTTDIANNTTDIADNTTDIANNTTDIADNTTDITNNTTDIADNTTDITNNTTQINTNTTDIANLQDTGVKYDDPATKDTVTLGGTPTTDGGVTDGTTITNLHQGEMSADSSDAVNGAQLYEVKQTANAGWNLTTNGKAGNKANIGPNDVLDFSTAGSNLTVSNTGNNVSFALADELEVNSVTTGNTVMNNSGVTVADGTGNITAITTGGMTVSNSAGNSATYDATGLTIQNGPSVTVNGIDAGGQRITNVAPGTTPGDAATVGQLKREINGVKNQNNKRFDALGDDIHELGERMEAGVASALAVASLPQAYEPGQSIATIAVGQFEGETGFAVGLSAITDSGQYVFDVNLNTNTQGDLGVSVGFGLVLQ